MTYLLVQFRNLELLSIQSPAIFCFYFQHLIKEFPWRGRKPTCLSYRQKCCLLRVIPHIKRQKINQFVSEKFARINKISYSLKKIPESKISSWFDFCPYYFGKCSHLQEADQWVKKLSYVVRNLSIQIPKSYHMSLCITDVREQTNAANVG